ncbi:5'-3' exonuclease H3TH domain-containing protein [Metamycoplasma spumans]|uniref:5'-3' exonuclease n=1 Tax=Metamycoplasma spumans TaxID=92406 RepID=UPI0034DD3759
MKKTLLVVDGTYLAYRSFYATAYGNNAILETSDGIQTNVIVGFFNTLFSLIKTYDVDGIYIAFDSRIKTFRHEVFADYKAGRQKAPTTFYTQLNIIHDLLDALNIKNFNYDGYEADDIIARCTKTYDADILIYSADQDLNQLINDNVSIIKKVKSEYIILNSQNFEDYYDFKPDQVIDYKAMVGDSSDNFKGIPGIGQKSASAMLKEFGSIENIYKNINNVKPLWAKKLLEFKDNAMRDKYIATLQFDFDLVMPEFKDLSIFNIDLSNEANIILDNLELKALKRKIKSSLIN